MVTKRPSFLKRQKELLRNARALEKRQARKERKEAKDAKAAALAAPATADRRMEGNEPDSDTES